MSRIPFLRNRTYPLALLFLALPLMLFSLDKIDLAAQPGSQMPTELQYVPPDAAIFVHLKAAELWGSSIGKAVQGIDQAILSEIVKKSKEALGVPPEEIQTVTAFWPNLKLPQEFERFGVVIRFQKSFDRSKLQAFLDSSFGKGKSRLETPAENLAVILIGFGDTNVKPVTGGKAGPISKAIEEASSGKHAAIFSANLAKLPDEIRGDELPPDFRGLQPFLKSETVTAILDMDKELSLEFRIHSPTPAKAIEVERAFGLVTKLLRDGVGQELKSLTELSQKAPKDSDLKDLLSLLGNADQAVKSSRISTQGSETRARVALPLDLPYSSAFRTAAVKMRNAAARSQSVNNLKQIALAMHNYLSAYDAFPPASVVNKRGKPILSWRVLILPYIEQNELYQQFKLDEPWDSPNNIKLLDKMPKTYAMPVPTGAKPNETHYRVLVGNGAAFDYLKGPKIGDFMDGTSNTILVVTAADPVPWTKPDELAFEPAKDMLKQLGFFPGEVSPAAFADGAVRSLSKTISKMTLNGAITRAGGEVLGPDF